MAVTIQGWTPSATGVFPHARSTIAVGPSFEPITLTEAKLYAGLDWNDGDPRDAWMQRLISAARLKVEIDTGLALPSQRRDVYFDALPPSPFILPAQSTPLQQVIAVSYLDATDTEIIVDPATYVPDFVSAPARLALAEGQSWPSSARSFQPWLVQIVSGWEAADKIPSALTHAVGLLTAHWATLGRDLITSITGTMPMPFTYDDIIDPFRVVYL